MNVVYDAGALIAADRGDRRFLVLHDEFLSAGVVPVVPAGVLAQVWRDPARQAGLVRTLRGCRVESLDRNCAELAGLRARRTKVSDVVDCSVAEAAASLDAVVMTSDPEDISRAGVPRRDIQVV